MERRMTEHERARRQAQSYAARMANYRAGSPRKRRRMLAAAKRRREWGALNPHVCRMGRMVLRRLFQLEQKGKA